MDKTAACEVRSHIGEELIRPSDHAVALFLPRRRRFPRPDFEVIYDDPPLRGTDGFSVWTLWFAPCRRGFLSGRQMGHLVRSFHLFHGSKKTSRTLQILFFSRSRESSAQEDVSSFPSLSAASALKTSHVEAFFLFKRTEIKKLE